MQARMLLQSTQHAAFIIAVLRSCSRVDALYFGGECVEFCHLGFEKCGNGFLLSKRRKKANHFCEILRESPAPFTKHST